MTRLGRAFVPGRSPMTLPSASIRTFFSPSSRSISAYSCAAFRFLERRRFDLADADLIVDRAHFVGAREIDGGAHSGRLKEGGAELGGALLRGR